MGLKDGGSGRQGSQRQNTPPHPQKYGNRAAMQSDRTFSIAFPTGDGGGGLGPGEAWVPFINKQLNTVGGFLL